MTNSTIGRTAKRKAGSLFDGMKFGLLLAVIVGGGLFFFQGSVTAEGEINTNKGIAIEGYDTVAYFTENAAIKGRPEFRFRWKNAEWHFASAENKNLFADNPRKYAPQYGGY